MPKRQVIDVHCHFFNAQYAIMELKAATWNYLQGNYPHEKGAARVRTTRGMFDKLDGIADFAAWIAGLLKAALSDCEGNYDTAVQKFTESALGRSGALTVAPLMMDIYFALDNNRDEEPLSRKAKAIAPSVKPFTISDDEKKKFEKHCDDIKKLILEELQKTMKTKRTALPLSRFDAVFDEARKALLAAPVKTRKGLDPYEGIELSPGYQKHLEDLENLARKYPGKVFPFLAVDPRRIGIMKLIDLKIKKGKGIFRGVKLYPPLGYLPTHPNLEAVYDYCSKYDVPITLHCSPGGINNFRGENYVTSWEGENHREDFQSTKGNKSLYYTAPEKWLPVLKKWPKLRINFAHFGGGDQLAAGHPAWMNDIIAIIETYEKAYTDVSYYTQKDLPQKIADVIAGHGILNSRLMFGTDFIMIMLDQDLGGLDQYFNHFSVFKKNLLYDNAKSFLKLQETESTSLARPGVRLKAR